MKTYRSAYLGGEIDLPDGWPSPVFDKVDGEVFQASFVEIFHWSTNTFAKPSSLQDVEKGLGDVAMNNPAYSHPVFGRMSVLGREQVWLRSRMHGKLFAKTYMLNFGRQSHYIFGYCRDEATFCQREPIWDGVVASYRPLPAYQQAYDEECRLEPGRRARLRLAVSNVSDSPYFAELSLMYSWDADLPAQEARALAARAIAFISCAVFDAAQDACIGCAPSPVPHGRRPAWLLQGASMPISIMETYVDVTERQCEIGIGPCMIIQGEPKPVGPQLLERLEAGFVARFQEMIA
jgi:hypothetical protein